MSEELVGNFEKEDIRKQVSRILADLGNPEPPLDLDQVRELLNLDLQYYSASDVTQFQEVQHRLWLAGQQVFARPTRLLDVIKKANLSALWVPDAKGIYIDSDTPGPKRRWVQAHEIGHSLLPWHREPLFGDNKTTLDPLCHEQMEAEANYTAGRLLFLNERFTTEALDHDLSFSAVQSLAGKYKNTLTTTMWRLVEERDPDHAVFALVSRHPGAPQIGGSSDGENVRYYIRSRRFRTEFSAISSNAIYRQVERLSTRRKRGPIFAEDVKIKDGDGNVRNFFMEAFCNSYELLTLGFEC